MPAQCRRNVRPYTESCAIVTPTFDHFKWKLWLLDTSDTRNVHINFWRFRLLSYEMVSDRRQTDEGVRPASRPIKTATQQTRIVLFFWAYCTTWGGSSCIKFSYTNMIFIWTELNLLKDQASRLNLAAAEDANSIWHDIGVTVTVSSNVSRSFD